MYRYCKDCKKKAPAHTHHGRHCCYCFLYWAVHEVWQEAVRGKNIDQLCLHCFRKRLGRDVEEEDFILGGYMVSAGFNAPIAKMVAYANSGRNDSEIW